MVDRGASLAVLVTAAGRHEHLRRLLAGLAEQTRPPDDVVVVDLATRSPQSLAAPQANAVRRILHPAASTAGPLQLAGGRNLAATSTTCELLVFLDVDCLPAADLVGRYEEVLTAHPEGLACGPVRYLRQGWAHRCGERNLTAAQLEGCSDEHPARPRIDGDRVVLSDEHERFWSLSFGVRRSTWELLGGFDEGFVGYGAEDTDLGLRAAEMGVPLAWFGGGTAYHQWHPPTRDDPARLGEMIANAHRFRVRWGRWPMSGWFTQLARAGTVQFDPDGDVLAPVRADDER